MVHLIVISDRSGPQIDFDLSERAVTHIVVEQVTVEDTSHENLFPCVQNLVERAENDGQTPGFVKVGVIDQVDVKVFVLQDDLVELVILLLEDVVQGSLPILVFQIQVEYCSVVLLVQ